VGKVKVSFQNMQKSEVLSKCVPKSWSHHTFTQNEVEISESGGAVSASNFIGKTGHVFSAELRWNKETGQFTAHGIKRRHTHGNIYNEGV
jgi:hypothetical protein